MSEKKNIFSAICKNNCIFLKTLIEITSQISSVNTEKIKKTIKQLFIKINNSEIELFSDSSKTVTSMFIIKKKFFVDYLFEESSPLCIGISLDILKKNFKNIHRSDKIKITIDQDEYNNFPNTIYFTLNDTKGFSIKFNIVQNIETNTYEDYKTIVKLPSYRLVNLCREIGGIKKIVKLQFNNGILRMSSSTVDIAENWVEFKMVENTEELKDLFLKSEYFKLISKISTFSETIYCLINPQGDLLFKTNINKTDHDSGTAYISILNNTTN